MKAPEAEQELLEALGKTKKLPLKLLLLDALERRHDALAAKELGKLLGDSAPEVQRAALLALKSRRLPEALDAVIDYLALQEERKELGLPRWLAQETLAATTGKRLATAKEWREFWTANGQGFKRPAKLEPAPDDPRAAKLFGTRAVSERIVILLDVSESMSQVHYGPLVKGKPQEKKIRIEYARERLAGLLAALPTRTSFTVFAYWGDRIKPAKPPLPFKVKGVEWLRPWSTDLKLATPGSKLSARDFVLGIEPKGMTFSWNALEHALRVEGVDTIWLVSDGLPSDLDFDVMKALEPDQVLERIRDANRLRRVVIETFAFLDAPAADAKKARGFGRRTPGGKLGLEDFMRDLARENGGRYTRIQ